jgi:acetyltransferase
VRHFDNRFIARLTQIDYARAMCFVAIDLRNGKMIGAARLHSDANYENAEYAILVRSDLKGHGLGWALMQAIIEYAKSEGLRSIYGQVLWENSTMLKMCSQLGFDIQPDPENADVRVVRLRLSPAPGV